MARHEIQLPDIGGDPGRECRLGIMGGTFDPIHYGHLVTAEQAREALALDLVLFMPAGNPAFKQDRPVTDAEDRYAMTVLATAASMDGVTSGVTPLIKKGFKITENAQTVSDILIDFDILCAAPKIMTGAGTGDILAKFCCLTDWKMSHLLTGESYSEESASLMRVALEKCYQNTDSICACGREGIDALLRALLISGYAMVIAGNSRPASGAEHHMSHFLEMDFLKRGKPIPLHGIKVGLGTLVSLRMYKRILEKDLSFEGQEIVARLAAPLPSPEEVARILHAMGCPTRFSQIGVSKDTVRDMLFNCYKIRERFTIMTLYNKYGLMKGAADELMDLYY